MKIKETTERISPNIDPRIQRVLSWNQNNEERAHPAESFTEEAIRESIEIAVIAKVNDIEKWKQLAGVRQIADLGNVPDENENVRLVTARVASNRIEEVRKSPIVLSLKASQILNPQLKRTVEEIKALPDLLPPDSQSDGGKGVVVGIVDYGCDFAHQNFINPDGTTRLLCYWDQSAIGYTDTDFGYGRLISRQEINAALKTPDPYAALNIPDPRKDTDPQTGEIDHWHGTHVMDIACGNGRAGASGVALKRISSLYKLMLMTFHGWEQKLSKVTSRALPICSRPCNLSVKRQAIHLA